MQLELQYARDATSGGVGSLEAARSALSADEREAYHLTSERPQPARPASLCLQYIAPQQPPALVVELRGGGNCSAEAPRAAATLDTRLAWEIAEIEGGLEGGLEGGVDGEFEGRAAGDAVGPERTPPKATARSGPGADGSAQSGTDESQSRANSARRGTATTGPPTAPTVIALGVAVRTHTATAPAELPLVKVFVASMLK